MNLAQRTGLCFGLAVLIVLVEQPHAVWHATRAAWHMFATVYSECLAEPWECKQ